MSKAWRKGSTSAWRRTRAQVLMSNLVDNNGLCTLQLPGCTQHANVVDHIYGRAITGDDPKYLRAVCASCNSRHNPHTQPDPPSNPHDRWL